MTTQPEALRLADALSTTIKQVDAEDDVIHVARWFVEDAAAELRRLHALNGELLEALKMLCESHSRFSGGVWDKARAAIAKAEGEA